MDNFYDKPSSDEELIPVILSGGSGSRLWPLSRQNYPKQYLNLLEKSNLSLIQNTYLRLRGLKNLGNPIIISSSEQRFILAEQLREINVKPNSIILEPFGRNTAPAIALASLKASENNLDPILIILSSDHKIEDEKSFLNVINHGLGHAREGRIVTFGITPDSPEIGYGYIESLEKTTKKSPSSKIKKFIEKPNLEVAKNLIKDNRYLWNSGIFLFRASVILKELEKLVPELLEICKDALRKGKADLDFFRVNKEVFQKCPNVPIDVAVMEKTKLGTVLNLDAGWDDIGSWKSVWNNSKKDINGNSIKGKVFTDKVKNCYLRSEERLIVGIDLEDLIVVETSDAILISKKDSSQKVKKIIEDLKHNNFEEAEYTKKSFRPWGSYINIEKGESWQVKQLEIKPKSSISLQMHHHRSEHWIVVNGTAKVEINSEHYLLRTNESIFVPLGAKHRLTNPSEEPLIIIEVQSGLYLGEDDIIRFEDNYGRAN